MARSVDKGKINVSNKSILSADKYRLINSLPLHILCPLEFGMFFNIHRSRK